MARSMDDLTVLNDMVDALVDDQGNGSVNWSFASAPARVHSIALPAGPAHPQSATYVRTAHIPPTLPPNVLAVPLEQCLFTAPRVKSPLPDNASSLTKLFVGNMRFEMTREALRWVLYRASSVDVPVTNVLVHVKAAASNSQPTGCASVYVTEADAEKLIALNQRIFCSATTLYVAPTAEIMTGLIEEKQILDIDLRGKKLRGPKNSMVIELSRGGQTPSSTPTGSFADAQYVAPSFASGTDSSVLLTGSFSSPQLNGHHDAVSPPVTPPLPVDSPSYERYPLQLQPHSALYDSPSAPPPQIADPVELFVGGIRYEASRAFVAWMLTRALSRRGYDGTIVTESHVRLFPGTQKRRNNNAGCAIVRVERSDAEKLQQLNHCVLCDAYGAYFGPNAEAMFRFIQTFHEKMRGGPSHAVVIERRKSTSSPFSERQPEVPGPSFLSSSEGLLTSSGCTAQSYGSPQPFYSSSPCNRPPLPSWMVAAKPSNTP